MNSIKIKEINVNATSGASVFNCIKECISLSFEKETIVNLFHNNDKFTINQKEIIDLIYENASKTNKMD